MFQKTAGGVVLKQQFDLSTQGGIISAGALEISGPLSRGRFLQGFEENLPLALDYWIDMLLHGARSLREAGSARKSRQIFSRKLAANFFPQPGLGESPQSLGIAQRNVQGLGCFIHT